MSKEPAISDEATPVALHLIVHGEVQGVGFRAFTRAVAQQLHLRGWVRNLPDETVEIWAEGPRAALERLLAAVRRGPAGGFVQRVDVAWPAPQGHFTDFRITYYG